MQYSTLQTKDENKIFYAVACYTTNSNVCIIKWCSAMTGTFHKNEAIVLLIILINIKIST